MVFPGRFSTGCLRCRQRKVKCDEGKPSCRRCYIYGKPCPGYTDQFHFRHRSTAPTASASKTKASEKNQATAHTVQLQFVPQESGSPRTTSRRGSEGTVGGDQDTTSVTIIVDDSFLGNNVVSSSSETWSEGSATDVWSPGILTAPTASYDHASVCYFVRRFVSPDETDGFPGHLSFLPNLYDHNNDSVLELATLSVAQMAAYNQFGGDEFKLQSYQNYGRALRRLQDTIHIDAEATDDKVVTAVLLLSTLNDITGDKSSDPDEHGPGLYYLLEKRGLEQLATRRGVELFLLSLIRLQVYSFLCEDYSYSDPGGIATMAGLFDPLLRAFSMMSRTLTIRNTLCRQADTMGVQEPGIEPPLSDQETASLIQTCFESLEEFDEWDRDAASYWQNTFEGRTLPTSLGEVGTSMIYCDPQTACVIVLVRSARLILLLSLLLYHDRLQQSGNTHSDDDRLAGWAQCLPMLHRDVHCCIDDMLASVPFALGDVDPSGRPTSLPYDGAGAIVILHPLRLIMFCGYATDDHMEKAKRILNRINASIGVRSAASWERAKAPLMSGFRGLSLNSSMRRVDPSMQENHGAGSDMLFTDAL